MTLAQLPDRSRINFAPERLVVRFVLVSRCLSVGPSAEAAHDKHIVKVRQVVAATARASKAKFKTMAIATLTGKALQAKLTNPKGWDRWWNSVAGDATFIFEVLPPDRPCKVYVDDRCGRFLVSYGTEDRRSFSWTKRGMKVAQVHALRFLWDAHARHTGQQCPIDLASVELV